MKLPTMLISAISVACAAEQTHPQTLLPLPAFHETWSDAEKQIIQGFAESINDFLAENKIENSAAADLKKYNAFKEALHRAIVTGKVEPSFNGDTLARWAAIIDKNLAVQVFIGLGEDPHARYYIEGLNLESGLVQEVIWAKNLT